MKLLARLEKNYIFWFLLTISIIFIFLRLPSLFEPYWYGDEGIYQAIGILLNNGEKLYIGAWDNKPPLLFIIYAIFNSNQFSLRLLSLVFGLISIFIFYFISIKLFLNNKNASIISTTIFAILFGTIIFEGNIANAENFMLLPILIGALLIISSESYKKGTYVKTYFLAGLLISVAFLTKIVAIFDLLAFTLFILIHPNQNLKNKISKLLPLILGFSIPFLLTLIYFLFTNNFKDFLDALLFGNIGYVGKENQFLIPQGLLIFKTVLLLMFVIFIYWKRRKIHPNLIFILLWFSFSLFSAFFSHRPYTHYLLMLLPSLSLMIGAVFSFKKERIFLVIAIFLTIITLSESFIIKTNIRDYYMNFISFNLGKKNSYEYQAFFDQRTPRDYNIANYIKANTKQDENIFIWGDNAHLYKLANKKPILRYTVAYHITYFPKGITEMKKAIEIKKPELIIIMPNNGDFPGSLNNYSEKINIQGARIYEKIF